MGPCKRTSRTNIWTQFGLLPLALLLGACGGSGSSSNGVAVDSPPTVDAGTDQTVTSGTTVNLTATVVDDGTTTTTWAQTSGDPVTLSSTSGETTSFIAPQVTSSATFVFEASTDDGVNNAVNDSTTVTVNETSELSVAFLSFGANVDIVLDGDEVVIEATGRPDHTSCYWDAGNASGLYVDCDPDITTEAQKSPGDIDDYNNLFTLRAPIAPTKAANSSATGLGPVGIAVSGAPIFNDQEGPNVALELGVINGFDRSGAHTGPQTYHYHLEPRAISFDDSELIGIIADGFFIYGRKCYSTGDYPTDLDISGGHISITQHTGTLAGDEEYHYHTINELYLSAYYLLFPENYQGTPSNIDG